MRYIVNVLNGLKWAEILNVCVSWTVNITYSINKSYNLKKTQICFINAIVSVKCTPRGHCKKLWNIFEYSKDATW